MNNFINKLKDYKHVSTLHSDMYRSIYMNIKSFYEKLVDENIKNSGFNTQMTFLFPKHLPCYSSIRDMVTLDVCINDQYDTEIVFATKIPTLYFTESGSFDSSVFQVTVLLKSVFEDINKNIVIIIVSRDDHSCRCFYFKDNKQEGDYKDFNKDEYNEMLCSVFEYITKVSTRIYKE